MLVGDYRTGIVAVGNVKASEFFASIALALVLLVACRPTATYYVGPTDLLSRMETLVYVGLTAYVVVNRHVPSKFVIVSWAFCFFPLLSSALNGGLTAAVASTYLKIALVSYYLDEQVRKHTDRTAKVGLAVLLALCVADVFTIILFKDGLFTDVRYENAYYTDILPGWFLGLKNNRMLWYLCLICLVVYRDYRTGRGKPLALACFALSIFAVAYVGSSTSTVVFLVLLTAYLFSARLSRIPFLSNPLLICIVALAVCALVVTASGFTNLICAVSSAFGKTASLSGRDEIWVKTIAMVAQSPVFGYGVQDTATRALQLGGVEAVNAHNQLLETLYVAGFLGFAGFLGVFFSLAGEGVRKGRVQRYWLAVFLLAVFIEMISEVLATVPVFWVALSLMRLFVSGKYGEANGLRVGGTRDGHGGK